MSSGTLVPFMCEVGLPADTFDIDLDCVVKTLPTIGPLFGSYKVQLDVFSAPYRLYNAYLHNNKLGIGMNMTDAQLPFMELIARPLTGQSLEDIDNAQINPSCILSYLGLRGIGMVDGNNRSRRFNGVPLLAYWETYKNYYANKQEGIGAVIHGEKSTVTTFVIGVNFGGYPVGLYPTDSNINVIFESNTLLKV